MLECEHQTTYSNQVYISILGIVLNLKKGIDESWSASMVNLQLEDA